MHTPSSTGFARIDQRGGPTLPVDACCYTKSARWGFIGPEPESRQEGAQRDGATGQGRDDDRRHGDRRGADRQRRRHGVRPARRAALPAVRRAAAARRRDPHHRRAARAGLRLHGVRLRALDRPAGRLSPWCRGPACSTPRRPCARRYGCCAPVLCITGQVPVGLPRSRPRSSARAARSARHPALADQMGGAHRAPGRRARDRQRGVPADAVGTARRRSRSRWPGTRWRRARYVEPLGAAAIPEAGRALAARGGGRRQAARRRQAADDHDRQRRAACQRGRARAGRGARRAGGGLPRRTRRRAGGPRARHLLLRRLSGCGPRRTR